MIKLFRAHGLIRRQQPQRKLGIVNAAEELVESAVHVGGVADGGSERINETFKVRSDGSELDGVLLTTGAEEIDGPREIRREERDQELEAARKTLEHAIALLPAEVQKKKYVLAKPSPTSREKFAPWSLKKVDHNTFKRDILSFLRGAYKDRKPTENMKEMHKLWEMFKHLPTVEESIQCAIEEIKAATRDA